MTVPDPPGLFVVGTSQSVASAAIRERAHVDLQQLAALVRTLIGRSVLEEAVPLSTCERLELYAVSKDPDQALRLLTRLLARKVGGSADDVRMHAYALRGRSAVRHLFRVCAGLESVVHGEAQILGQVREAAHHPLSGGSKGPVLHRLFEKALSTGKKVRSETEIGRGSASLVGAALSLLRQEIPSLASVSALVLGAGETGALMARLLRKSGVRHLVVANRTEATAQELASSVAGEARALSDIVSLLRRADLVVGAAAVGEPIVKTSMLREIWSDAAADVPRYYLDLAHPRCLDPGLAGLPGVRLIDLERVFERVEAARAARTAQAPRAEEILREQTHQFLTWLRSRENVAVVRAVRDRVLDLARTNAERLGEGRSDEEREEMRRSARAHARTLLHPLTVALRRADPSSPDGRALLERAAALFGVEPETWDAVGRP